jgi:hypothetical protein
MGDCCSQSSASDAAATAPPHDVIRLLQEASVAVYFECSGFDAYVTAPAAAIDGFTVRYTDECEPTAGWEQTNIHPAAFERELHQRDWQFVAATRVPEVVTNAE